jgi:diacylglycerol O-acyltransferase
VIPIDPIGLLFLALETPERPASMCGVAIYDPPRRGGAGFAQKVVRAFRGAAAQPPFERRPTWIRHGRPTWEIVEPDLSHHVRHVALPAPGSLNQLLELVGTLYAPLLDRNLPLWECYVIEGLENGRLGIMLKVHHALLDGMGTMRLLRESHSKSRDDRHLRPIWGQLPRGARVAAQQRKDRRELTGPGASPAPRGGMLATMTEAAGTVMAMGRGALGASGPLPLRATPNALNAIVRSSVRSYAGFALPLARVKAVGQAHGATVNDVVLSIIDDGANRYLTEVGKPASAPLVALVAISLRGEGDTSAGNVAAALPVRLGANRTPPRRRLQSISHTMGEIKNTARRAPRALLQGLAVGVFGAQTVLDLVPGLGGAVPNYNLLVSNMSGPPRTLYLGGARLVGFLGTPIVPPGAGLNVTLLSYDGNLWFSIGAAPEAVPDAPALARCIEAAFADLRAAAT